MSSASNPCSGKPCPGSKVCACGCCSGTGVMTPAGETNLPGRSAIVYRTGTWATFKESMLARLSSADYPALAPLKTRDSDDFSIALLDATSVMLDILTFYQERLANESYLRTATQLYSLTQLSRLIGYRPTPGIAASTYLAFTLKAATGVPTDPTTKTITIPAGTQVQSVPAQGQKPQSFETSNPILAKSDWNALPVRAATEWKPATGDTSVLLEGTATQLQPGDAILIVGDERLKQDHTSPQWDVRLIRTVLTDTATQSTRVSWTEGLGGGSVAPAQTNPRFFALRQRASLFGFTAINPVMMDKKTIAALHSVGQLTAATPPTEWDFGTNNASSSNLATASLLDLDAAYAKLTAGGWLVLIRPDGSNSRSPAGYVSLYLMDSVTTVSRSDYGVSGRITRAHTDTANQLSNYYAQTRSSSVLTQSEELVVAQQPLDFPLYGTFLDLSTLRPDLVGVTAVAITGKSQKLTVNAGVTGLVFTPDDGSSAMDLGQGDILTVLAPPQLFKKDGAPLEWGTATGVLTLYVADASGRSGSVQARLSQFTLTPSLKSDPVVKEFALVSAIKVASRISPHTRILLRSGLANCYERAVTTVNANVGLATAGASVTEILGNGSAATPNKVFTLKQTPLTYQQSPTLSGRLSSLQIRANQVAWKEVQSLYGQGPAQQVFATLDLPGGAAQVIFGDGVEGSTLPTGQDNIQASYRVGSGAAGNVASGAITTLVDRPLGVSAVVNPAAATGGQDAQPVDGIRANAPLGLLTLGRAVSVADYQNFAANFAGIARAYALWVPNGASRGIFLTVAGAGGAALSPGNPTRAALVTSLRSYGNPNVPLFVQSFVETLFGFAADLLYDPAYDASAVKPAVQRLVTATYSFAQRSFAQGVSSDEIAALIQSVPGVLAVNVKSLTAGASSTGGDLGTAYSVSAYNQWSAHKISIPRAPSGSSNWICPYVPVAGLGALPPPAEILVLDPNPKSVVLGVMA